MLTGLILDVSSAEERNITNVLEIAILPDSGNVSYTRIDSVATLNSVKQLVEVAKTGCFEVHKRLKRAIQENARSRT